MQKITRSTIINAATDAIFAYVSDPMNAPEWLPSMMEVTEVTGSGKGQHYRWRFKMVGVPLDGESTVTEHIPNERRVVESKGGATATWTYTFEPSDGGTKFGIDVEYTIPIPVLRKLAERLVLKRNEREADMAMENIKDKMEG